VRERLNQIISKHTGQAIEKIFEDSDRDFILEAEDALNYGLVDKIIVSRE
jgi:ATP-dependent Clp protease protease subunit